MHILYMNQGGGGQWGTIKYSNFDLILLAESSIAKEGFELNWHTGVPVMSVQTKSDNSQRVISEVKDLDLTAEQVRPLATFTTTVDGIRVVFVHLKSGNASAATNALNAAVDAVIKSTQFGYQKYQKILWIGDFNRADDSNLKKACNAQLLHAGGGQALWDLDRAYTSGDWSGYTCTADVVSTAGADHGHIAIGITIGRAA